ncbi:sporulation protein YqfC [uncultured Clostridium sp.]|uniref:YabP/YqfC family sporulation protein n=1 Tax=Paeniclostridium hominis TaxID=2764329 RepID=A0ABR7JZM8_9FIRM|nr:MULTISPECIES: YabP/YqfC family sporulation protein [Paeniclostridium]MDU1539198.1 YabP/YqfC family sporulation protein [Paeniclostridium sordellii]SCJ21856.1 sporulation protein YqfC [uncultured Clostridium sp.]MBC6002321.1 YabP/YqfC family sporulation protein [Paeniclostridium hominis]MBC8631180.1 YabP/YqfC family sporulation protein [[Eubacterium] tenue]MDU2591314.1 YabP/YqfC family sporulation protein [Paeniclostridium sordellii]
MIEVPTDLQVNQPSVTILSNSFISIENYKSILEYDINLIKIKTKINTIKISGDKMYLKYITDTEIGIKGIIYSVEYTT